MSSRQGAPTHDAIGDLLGRIDAIEERAAALEAAIERVNIAPLQFVVTVASPGPPPTFTVELVNPQTGGTVTLAANL